MNSDKVYLFFTGYHSVAAASDVLNRYNIANRIVRAPVGMRNSCSFAVLIDKSEEEMSRYLLNLEKVIVKS
ncbi:MAG: putative Se/S carrier-like protein [Anaerovoracaceae bacterium]|nr:putative Se/S carrier-like protein [Anaerovoracaceae bacterium]